MFCLFSRNSKWYQLLGLKFFDDYQALKVKQHFLWDYVNYQFICACIDPDLVTLVATRLPVTH